MVGMTVQPEIVTPEPQPKPKRVRKTWDLVTTIILFVVYVFGLFFGSFLSAFALAFSGDSCGASSLCNSNQQGVGFAIAVIGAWFPLLIVLILSIAFLVTKRIAFWIPIAGIVLSLVITVIGFVIAFSAVTPNVS
jgi:Family of unknown function (DUF6264)